MLRGKTPAARGRLFCCLLALSLPAVSTAAALPSVIASLLEPDEHGNVIPDFSHVGYMGGGAALPHVPAVKELSPEPDGCDRERIQRALDEIGDMPPGGDGFRGALLLRAGEYRVDGPLRIENSGVVLRGEGQFPGGTAIISTARHTREEIPDRHRHALIFLGNPERSRMGFLEPAGPRTEITGRTAVGNRWIEVKNAGGFSAGDKIAIELRPNEKWVEKLGREDWHLPRYFQLYEKEIIRIEDNWIKVDVPLVFYIEPDLLETKSVWAYSGDARISQSGVEHLRLKTFNEDDHMSEDNAQNAVTVNRAKDCWVKNVTGLHLMFSTVSVLYEARNITVQDSAYLRPVSRVRGGRRYPFYVQGSRTLVQRCYARSGRHSFASSPRVAGPNVFLDCFSENDYRDIGPHQQWDTGFLYDNIIAPQGRIHVQHVESNHGWRGANIVFWNCKTAEMICDAPRTGDTNWSIGNIAHRNTGRVHEAAGRWISYGRRVEPRSLYLYQLEKRLGPGAAGEIAVEAQVNGCVEEMKRYLGSTLGEFSEREKANRDNLIPGCPELKEFATGGQGAMHFTGAAEELGRRPVFDYLKDGVIEKIRNPVHGDESALKFPAGTCMFWWFPAVQYPDPGVSEYTYSFEFDFKTGERASFTPRVDFRIFSYDEYNKTALKSSVRADLSGAEPGEGWRRYTDEFTISPEFDEFGMPYLTRMLVRFTCDEAFAVANPGLKIVKAE